MKTKLNIYQLSSTLFSWELFKGDTLFANGITFNAKQAESTAKKFAFSSKPRVHDIDHRGELIQTITEGGT